MNVSRHTRVQFSYLVIKIITTYDVWPYFLKLQIALHQRKILFSYLRLLNYKLLINFTCPNDCLFITLRATQSLIFSYQFIINLFFVPLMGFISSQNCRYLNENLKKSFSALLKKFLSIPNNVM